MNYLKGFDQILISVCNPTCFWTMVSFKFTYVHLEKVILTLAWQIVLKCPDDHIILCKPKLSLFMHPFWQMGEKIF